MEEEPLKGPLNSLFSWRILSRQNVRAILIGLFSLFHAFSWGSTDIRVRLFSSQKLQRIEIKAYEGEFVLMALRGEEVVDTVCDLFAADHSIEIKRQSNKLNVYERGLGLGSFDRLQVWFSDSLDIQQLLVKDKERIYRGKLDVWSSGGELLVINEVELEEYVAGVVESEGGHILSLPYFKAQAVLARTFAVKNWNKHSSYGYNLKDDVTSQVYHHMAYLRHSDQIRLAVQQTRDSILLDNECEPILAAFHANSGGQTANSEDAWLSEISYLRSRPDPHSLEGPSAKWEKRISQREFLNYLAKKFNTAPDDILLRKAILNLPREERLADIVYKERRVRLKDVRKAFKLRSAYFSVKEDGNDFILLGRGFGHGVGMSQDGAMVMAGKGFDYKDILYFYFSRVELDQLRFYPHLVD